MIKQLEKHLIVFVAKDFSRGVGLEKFLPAFAIICGTDSGAVDLAKRAGLDILCVAEKNSEGENSGKILESKKAQSYIKKLQKEKRCKKVSILTFKGNSKVELVCKKNGWGYLNLDAATTNRLEEKANFESLLKKYKGPMLPTVSGRLNEIDPRKVLCRSSKKTLAIQFTHGFAGQTTRFVAEKEFGNFQKKFPEKKVKVTPFIIGETLTLNGCIYGGKVFISYPFLQKTGLPEFSRHPGGTCGVIFNKKRMLKKVSEQILKKTVKVSYELAEVLKKHGLRGFFGFDLITDGKEVFPIELNPRLTANIHPFTIQQISHGLPPFLLLHVLEFLKIKIATPNPKKYLVPLRGETTSLRNVTDKELILNEKKRATGYSFEYLLGHPEIKEMYILLKNGSKVKPDERWGERWNL